MIESESDSSGEIFNPNEMDKKSVEDEEEGDYYKDTDTPEEKLEKQKLRK